MTARSLVAIVVHALLAIAPLAVNSQTTTGGARAVRRDIPITRMIQRAFQAGTRDSTGRPGRNYWQLWTDYKINASLDPATSIVTGHETVVIHNNSDSAMRGIVLRLDQNFFLPNVPRLEAASELTDGMQISRLVINGQALNVTDTIGTSIPGSMRRAPSLSTVLKNTSARIPIATPIAAHGTGTLEADWKFRVPRADNGRGERMGRWADTLYQVAQWYPRVAVSTTFEPAAGTPNPISDRPSFTTTSDTSTSALMFRRAGSSDRRAFSRILPKYLLSLRVTDSPTCSNPIRCARLSPPPSEGRENRPPRAIALSGISSPIPLATSRGPRPISSYGTQRARRFLVEGRFR